MTLNDSGAPRDDDLDEEFAKIIAGLDPEPGSGQTTELGVGNGSGLEEDPETKAVEEDGEAQDLQGEGPLPVDRTAELGAPPEPDDPGSAAGRPGPAVPRQPASDKPSEASGWIALVLSPIDSPGALRAALDMVGSPGRVVQLGHTTAVYLDSATDSSAGAEVATSTEDQELLALLGDDRPVPAAVDDMAQLVSKLAKPGAVALVSFTKEDPTAESAEGAPPALTGNILGRRYVGGESEEKLSAGLVLAGMPLAAEELLLGRLTPDDIPDVPRGPWTGWLKGRGKRF